jgi:osmotically-inducible protein OsmY
MHNKEENRNSTRGDSEIARDVIHAMKADFEVPDDRIRVRVRDRAVTIEGTVARDSQKDAAENCAKRVKGVRGITNKIEVEPAALPPEAQ